MTIEFTNQDAQGVVAVAPRGVCFGISAKIVASLQTVLADLDNREVVDTLRMNGKPEQDMMGIVFGGEEELPMVALDFQAYSAGEINGEEFVILVADNEGEKQIAFAPLEMAKTATVDKLPQGGVSTLPVAVEEWEQFIQDLVALELPK